MLIGKIKQLEAEGEEKNLGSVDSTFIDTDIFNEALKDTTKMKQKIDNINTEHPFFNKLSEDMFHTFYKPQPKIFDKANVVDSLHLENDLLKELISNDKIEKLRGNTVGDMFNSTLSLNCFQDKAYKIIQEWIEKSEKNKEAMDKMNEAINMQEELRKLLENLEDEPENDMLQKMVNDLQKQVNNANQEVQQAMNGTSPTVSLNSKLQQAINETAKTVGDVSEALNNFFGGVGPGNGDGPGAGFGKGTLQKLPYAEKMMLADALMEHDKLKEISKKLGRMKQLLNDINKKPSKHGNTVSDVGIGNNLARVLSSEKMFLLDPDLEYYFYKKYISKSLLEYKTQGEEEMRGPIVVCVDDSGSMRGSKEYWSKAFAIAMLLIAMAEKRAYRCIIFSDGVDKVFDFTKDDYSTERVIELAEYFQSGGTSYVETLRESLKSINESKFNKADILFISDGDPNGYLPEKFKKKFNNAKKEKEFFVQGMLIGKHNKSYMEEFCDTIITLDDLNSNDELVNIFSKVKDN